MSYILGWRSVDFGRFCDRHSTIRNLSSPWRHLVLLNTIQVARTLRLPSWVGHSPLSYLSHVALVRNLDAYHNVLLTQLVSLAVIKP